LVHNLENVPSMRGGDSNDRCKEGVKELLGHFSGALKERASAAPKGRVQRSVLTDRPRPKGTPTERAKGG